MTAPKGMIPLGEAIRIALARQSTGALDSLSEAAATMKRLDNPNPRPPSINTGNDPAVLTGPVSGRARSLKGEAR